MAIARADVDVRLSLAELKRDLNAARRDTKAAADSMQRDMDRASGAATDGFNALSAEMSRAKKGVRDFSSELSSTTALLSTFLAATGASAAIAGIVQMGDEYALLRGRLQGVLTAGETVDGVFSKLLESAQKNRAPVQELATIYTRLRQSIAGLGDAEALAIGEALSQSLAISGANAAETASFLRQIGQALASGVLRGDEFNSMMESNSRFARMLADELGVGVGELRAMAEEGQLTADVIREAIAGGAAQLREEFADMPQTVAASFTRLQNALFAYVGNADQASGATRILAGFISGLADNVQLLADVAIVAAAAGIANLAGRGIGALVTSIGTATAAAGGLRFTLAGLTALMGGPLAAVLTVAAVGFMTMKTRADEAREATDKITAGLQILAGAVPRGAETAIDGLKSRLQETASISDDAAEASLRLRDAQNQAATAAANNARAQAALAEVQRVQAIETLRVAIAAAKTEQAALMRQMKDAADRSIRAQENPGLVGLISPEAARQNAMKRASQWSTAQRQLSEVTNSLRVLEDGLSAVERGALSTAGAVQSIGQLTGLSTGSGGAGGGSEKPSRSEPKGDKYADFLDGLHMELVQDVDRKAKQSAERMADAQKSAAEDAQRRAEAIIEQSKTQLERYRDEAGEIIALFEAGVFSDLGAQKEANEAFVRTLEEMAREAKSAADALAILDRAKLEGLDVEAVRGRIGKAARAGAAGSSDSVVSWKDVSQAARDGFKDAARSSDWGDAFADRFSRVFEKVFDRSFDNLWNMVFQSGQGAGGGIGGGFFSAIASIFGGGRAGGGPVSPGRGYRVAENGPELLHTGAGSFLIPSSPGQITSASGTRAALAGGGAAAITQVFNQTFHGVGPDFAREIKAATYEAAEMGKAKALEAMTQIQRARSSL